jgi:4-hydroxybenzoate polyprenyltransferase
MTFRAVFLHLRVHFSLLLMPVFWFAVSQVASPDWGRVVVVGVILHLLLYPASHAYNSYYDKDEGPVGGLATPPPVDATLLRTAWWLDAAALLAGAWVGWPFVAYLLAYGFVSKAYSYDQIRLKKYPILSWLTIGLFQGGLTYLGTYQAVSQSTLPALADGHIWLAAGLSTLNLLAIYPITQVYQHEEDARRGDLTISRVLGIRGTFLATFLLFNLSLLGFYQYFTGRPPFYWLLLALLSAGVYFVVWYARVHRQAEAADFRSTMYMTGLAGLGLNAFFITLLICRC